MQFHINVSQQHYPQYFYVANMLMGRKSIKHTSKNHQNKLIYGKLNLPERFKFTYFIYYNTIIETFRALIYATRVTFDSQKELGLPLDKINVNAKGISDNCIIYGSEFYKYLSSPESLVILMNHCGAFSRANLLIAVQERIKGYCLNSSINNKIKFFESKDDSKHKSALYMLKCLRDSATHWKPINSVHYSDKYGGTIEFGNMVVTKEMKENELSVSNFELLKLVDSVKNFVIEELD